MSLENIATDIIGVDEVFHLIKYRKEKKDEVIRILEIRDLQKHPLDARTLERSPYLQRSRYLVTAAVKKPGEAEEVYRSYYLDYAVLRTD